MRLMLSCHTQITHMLANLPASACKLDIVLLWELLEDEDAASALLPFNLPRNLARLQVGVCVCWWCVCGGGRGACFPKQQQQPA
jgi:hypothetical protein